MDPATRIAIFINVVLSGGLLGMILRNWLAHRKLSIEKEFQDRRFSIEENEDLAERREKALDKALAVVTGQRDDALALVAQCNNRLEKMEMEVQGLRLARDLDPFPNWIIGLDGRYLFVNREFEKVFLEPAGHDYRNVVGRSHDDVWPEAFCRTLRNLDDLARRVPDGRARATTNLVIGSAERTVTVHKFPVRVRGTIVAFAGFITDIVNGEEAVL